ncbi:MAG TPA: OstA-like protein [Niastella sp.]
MIRYVLSLLVTLVVLLSFDKVHAQVITTRPGADTMKLVTLINADRLSYNRPDSLTDMQTLAGHVKLRQGTTLVNCDSAVFNKKTRFLEAFGNVHIIDNDTVNIRSQYLQYYVDTKMANLKNNVSLTDSKSTLYTQELQYDLNLKIGTYHNGGKLINQTSVLTSQEGTYYEELKDVYFKHNVDLKDPKYTLKTDSLLYNTNTQIATFIAPTTIIDSAKRVIKTSDGFYDTRNRKAFFGKRPVLNDGAVKIIADNIDSDDSTGISNLRGNAVYVDTAQGVSILANSIKANRDDGTFLATEHPLMIIKQDQDSIYITADTLYSGRLSKLYKDPSSLQSDPKRLQRDTSSRKRDSGSLKPNIRSIQRDTSSLQGDTSNLLQRDTSNLQRDTISPDPDPDTSGGGQALKRDTVSLKSDTVSVKQDTISLKKDTAKRIAAEPTRTKQPRTNKKTAKTTTAKTTPAASKPPASADTTKNKTDSADRYFQAWHHVRIFTDSMQAMSDSLFYSGKDSIFKLFTDPVMWASKSQITGDTIFLYTKNKKMDRLYVFENAFAVNLSDKGMYNQLKGNRLNGYFNNGEIDYMRAQGNGESIYYVKDEKNALVGVNNATSDIIDMRFKNKELNKVVFISEVNGTMYPIKQATEQNKILRSFKWLEDKRPKTKFELFEDIKPVIIKDSADSLQADSLQIEPPLAPATKVAPTGSPKVPAKEPQKEATKEKPIFRRRTTPTSNKQ